MRVLVVGTVPPSGGSFAQLLGEVAADLAEQGHTVEVCSPDARAAAHRTARLDGLWLALEVALGAARFDALVLRLEPGVPCRPTTGRLGRALALVALGAALRLWRDVTIRVDSPAPIPGGFGGRAARGVWASARRIVVGCEEDAAQLAAAPGVERGRIAVEPPGRSEHAGGRDGWPAPTEEDLQEEVLALVRIRAASGRGCNDARAALGAASAGPFSESVFATPPRRGLASPRLARLVLVEVGRRALRR
ncbi:MAG TPA: hypothetical protein VKV23_07685 [Acidimicrobiales bacterium]|nr:hypothetical protein [Acidimicrobiales bacterium]